MNNQCAIEYDDTEISPNVEKIRELNDKFRKSLDGGKVLLTAGVAALDYELQAEIIAKVKNFNEFDFRNDPYQEHDFGRIEVKNYELFWKIDCYDLNYEFASEDPSNPDITNRVLTVLLAEEY